MQAFYTGAIRISKQNMEAFRGVLEAINDRGPDAGLDLLDSEVEFYEDPEFPEAEVFRGRDEVVGNFRKFTGSFEHYRVEIEDLRDAGGDKVMAVLREEARGKTSGVEVERRSGWVFTFRDGKALRVEIDLDPGDAFEAVGLAG
jgi:ketosteroid isomerase-like protein